jgi:hypothetical protein
MARPLKPLPISGTRVNVTGGPWKGLSGTVDSYNCGRLYCSLQKADKSWILAGPINPDHMEEVPR